MKIICIGKNYSEHVKEMKSDKESNPVFFLKADSCLQKDSRPFFIPDFTNNLQYETEIVLRIGRLGKSIPEKFAHRYYDKITVGIDFTARDLQADCKSKGLPWEISKSFDQAARIGEFIDPEPLKKNENLEFWLKINGKNAQTGYSADMIFDQDRIISYLSRFMTLKTGDLIFTGTPAGVGNVDYGDIITGGIGKKELLKFPVK